MEFVISKVPIPLEKFFKVHSFASLANLVELGYVKIDKELVIQFAGEDDDSD